MAIVIVVIVDDCLPNVLENYVQYSLAVYTIVTIQQLQPTATLSGCAIFVKEHRMLLPARLHIVCGGSIVLFVNVCGRLSSSVALHGGPAGGFTHTCQAMTSCRLQCNYSSTVTLRGGPVVYV